MYKEEILKRAEAIKDELIKIRRDIHAHPELGLREERTANVISEKLKEMGLKVRTNVGVTGVVGVLEGKYPGKTIMLRADMDCLELTELNDVEYKSQYPGRMHACGHDAHTAWLLGAAMILSGLKDRLHGSVKFLFQPSEEADSGAERTIKDGVLEGPKVDIAVGAHIWPSVESGKIGVKYGPMMAAPDTFNIIIYGKGGHGAEPHKCVDPIATACQVYMALQTIVSRKVDPVEPVVITVGKFNGGTGVNIIPDRVEMAGTVRTLTNEQRSSMPGMMESLIKGITEATDASYSFRYEKHVPPVINDEEVTMLVEESAGEILGKDNVVRVQKPTMGGEDFSFFQQHIPAAFFMVGTHNPEKGITKPLHNPEFNIDEDVLYKASAVLAECAVRYLNRETL